MMVMKNKVCFAMKWTEHGRILNEKIYFQKTLGLFFDEGEKVLNVPLKRNYQKVYNNIRIQYRYNTKMDIIFMNSKNRKTSDPYTLIVNFLP